MSTTSTPPNSIPAAKGTPFFDVRSAEKTFGQETWIICRGMIDFKGYPSRERAEEVCAHWNQLVSEYAALASAASVPQGMREKIERVVIGFNDTETEMENGMRELDPTEQRQVNEILAAIDAAMQRPAGDGGAR